MSDLGRRSLVTFALMLMFVLPVIGAQPVDTKLDGYWFSDEHKYALKIDGFEGVAVLSNSSRYSPGDVMLRFRSTSETTISGQQIFTNGAWVGIEGELVGPDTLELRGGGYTWRMIRR